MTLKEIRSHLHKAPFRPVIIRLGSGRSHLVEHPNYLFLPPVGDSFLIVSKDGDFHHIDADQVQEIELARSRRRTGG